MRTQDQICMEVPVEEAGVVDLMVEVPVEVAPVVEFPVEEAPVVEVPVEEAPVVEVPVEEAPVMEVPLMEAPIIEIVVEAASEEEAPVVSVPVEGAPVVVVPMKEVVSMGRCEVGVQWERPEGQHQELAVQSRTRCSDVAVQVDLIGLSGARPDSVDVPLRCVSVRPEEPGGGALWLCCLHSPPGLLCPAATKTPTRTITPDQEPYSLNESGLSLPSMPICGESPSSPCSTMQAPDLAQDAPDSPDTLNTSDTSNTLQPTPEAPGVTSKAPDMTPKAPGVTPEAPGVTPEAPGVTPEAPEDLGFMAPLSSDEEGAAPSEHVEFFPTANPVIKRGRGRPKSKKNLASLAANARRRNPNARQAGLPLRYQLDYDLQSPELGAANQQPGNDEGAEPGVKQEDGRVLFLPYYGKTLDVAKLKEKVDAMKQEGDSKRTLISPNMVKTKRRPGRPRKVRPKDFEMDYKVEVGVETEEDNERPGSAELSDRPRRKDVGPPLRYLLESENLSGRKRARARLYDEGSDWLSDIKIEELEEPAIRAVQFFDEGLDKLKLGDLHSGSEGRGGTVKKVKILSPHSKREHGVNGLQDFRDEGLNEGNHFWKGANGQRQWHKEVLIRPAEFLIHRDEWTGRTTFISPCFVKLEPLKE